MAGLPPLVPPNNHDFTPVSSAWSATDWQNWQSIVATLPPHSQTGLVPTMIPQSQTAFIPTVNLNCLPDFAAIPGRFGADITNSPTSLAPSHSSASDYGATIPPLLPGAFRLDGPSNGTQMSGSITEPVLPLLDSGPHPDADNLALLRALPSPASARTALPPFQDLLDAANVAPPQSISSDPGAKQPKQDNMSKPAGKKRKKTAADENLTPTAEDGHERSKPSGKTSFANHDNHDNFGKLVIIFTKLVQSQKRKDALIC